MSTEIEVPPPRSSSFIRSPQDFWGGLVLLLLAMFAFWAAWPLPGMRGFAFGPGTAPRMFAVILGALGAAVMVTGVLTRGPKLERYAWRGPLFITASTIAFALCIRPLGLVIASFVSIMLAAAATEEVRWGETVIVAIALTVFCSILFPYGLNLPMPLWPRF